MKKGIYYVIPGSKIIKTTVLRIFGELCVGAEMKHFNHKGKLMDGRKGVFAFRQTKPNFFISEHHFPRYPGYSLENNIILNGEGGAFQIIWKIKANISKPQAFPPSKAIVEDEIWVTWNYGKSKDRLSRPNSITPFYAQGKPPAKKALRDMSFDAKATQQALINNHLFASSLRVNIAESSTQNYTVGLSTGKGGLAPGFESQSTAIDSGGTCFFIQMYFNKL